MPIYEYKCDKCGAVVIQAIWMDDTGNIHDGRDASNSLVCGGILRRIYSTFGIVVR